MEPGIGVVQRHAALRSHQMQLADQLTPLETDASSPRMTPSQHGSPRRTRLEANCEPVSSCRCGPPNRPGDTQAARARLPICAGRAAQAAQRGERCVRARARHACYAKTTVVFPLAELLRLARLTTIRTSRPRAFNTSIIFASLMPRNCPRSSPESLG